MGRKEGGGGGGGVVRLKSNQKKTQLFGGNRERTSRGKIHICERVLGAPSARPKKNKNDAY